MRPAQIKQGTWAQAQFGALLGQADEPGKSFTRFTPESGGPQLDLYNAEVQYLDRPTI